MEYKNDNIRLVAFSLYCKEISGNDNDLLFVKDDDINLLWDKYKWVMEGLNENHTGDCTNDAISCLRCRADNLIEDAKYIIGHWQNNDEILRKRNVEIKKHLDESMLMSKAIRKGDYTPVTVSETTHGQTLVQTVDKTTGKTWEELKDELCKTYQK